MINGDLSYQRDFILSTLKGKPTLFLLQFEVD